MTVTVDYRLAVLDARTPGGPLRYDQPSYASAYAAWVLLRDYGRDEVTAWIERRSKAGWAAMEGHYPLPANEQAG